MKKKVKVIDILPGDVVHLQGTAGVDGILWSYTTEDEPQEVVFKGPGAYVPFEMVLRLKDKGRRGKGEHRLTEWGKRMLAGLRA